VLDPDRIDGGIVDTPCDARIIAAQILLDLAADIRMHQRLFRVGERIDIATNVGVVNAKLFDNIAGEGGDSAFARSIGPD